MALNTCSKCNKEFYGVGCPDCDYPARLPDASEAGRRKLVGFASLAVSVYVVVVGFVAQSPLATRLQLLIAAIIFALAGVGSIRGAQGRTAAFMGGLICLGMSALGFFAAFGSGVLSDGIPFIPEAWNQMLGRTMFGLGACISAAMSFYFLRQSQKRRNK